MEFRWMGDNSVTEGYAMLFDHLMQDAGWLQRYTGLEKKTMPAYLRAAGFEELHFLRRYCAKLIYETQLYGGDVSWDALPDLYVERSRRDDVPVRRADAFVDVDPRFYAARYLRAWQLQALIARDAGRAVRRGLVAESARGAVDRAGAVRRGAARAGAGAGGARGGEGAELRAAGRKRRADAGVREGAGAHPAPLLTCVGQSVPRPMCIRQHCPIHVAVRSGLVRFPRTVSSTSPSHIRRHGVVAVRAP